MKARPLWTTSAILVALASCHSNTALPPSTSSPAPIAESTGRPTRLRIIATNDFHGALEPRPDTAGVMRGGAPALATLIAAARAECLAPACVSILVDGGDEFQGSAASNFAFGRPVTEIFNSLGYSASALGNHEFDWGQDTLRVMMRRSRYEFLGANVRYKDGRDVEWIPDDTLVTRDGVRIGIIGIITTNTPNETRPASVAGLRFDEPAPIVDSLARRLRARGADVVVVVAHAGAFCRATESRSCSGEITTLAGRLTEKVDAIVSGHTHTLIDTEVNGIPVVEARSNGTALAVIDLPLGSAGRATRQVRDVLSASVASDPLIASIVARATSAVSGRTSHVEATLASNLSASQVADLIADAVRSVARADIAFINSGGVRGALAGGPVTYGRLFEIQPFTDMLFRVTVRGRDLREYIERRVRGRFHDAGISGATVVYDPNRTPGSRVLEIRLSDGSWLADDREYSVGLNDFMVTNAGYGFGTAALRTEDLNTADLDGLIAYLHGLPQPVAPPSGPRFVIRAASPR